MSDSPSTIDGACVEQFAIVEGFVQPTGNTRHLLGIENDVMEPAKGLAIVRYDGDVNCYLFYCDENWTVLTDGWHETVADAMEQAEFEYRGITSRCQVRIAQ